MWIIQSPEMHIHFDGQTPPEFIQAITNNNKPEGPSNFPIKKFEIPKNGANITTTFSKDKT